MLNGFYLWSFKFISLSNNNWKFEIKCIFELLQFKLLLAASWKYHKPKFEAEVLTFILICISSEMQALEPVCITLGDQQTLWALDIHGNLWFRTGIVSKKPQGDDNHWWQVGIYLFTSFFNFAFSLIFYPGFVFSQVCKHKI